MKAQGKTHWTIKQTTNYAKKYGHILYSGNCSEILTLSSRNKHHAMVALASLAKFHGQYDRFQQLKQRYNLKWSSGQESLQSFNRFFNPGLSLDVMLQRIKQMIRLLPSFMGQIVRFSCLVGLRPAETVEAVKLINDKDAFLKYYKPERMALHHFAFPDIFFRQTKKAYISFVSPEMLELVIKKSDERICNTITIPSHNAIRLACRKRSITMDMRFCRKIYGSWLHQHGSITAEEVDFLQGRISTSVFSRHYLTPDA